MKGTSMATPVVSGIVALLKQAHPEWKTEDIKILLKKSETAYGDIYSQGYGLIDL